MVHCSRSKKNDNELNLNNDRHHTPNRQSTAGSLVVIASSSRAHLNYSGTLGLFILLANSHFRVWSQKIYAYQPNIGPEIICRFVLVKFQLIAQLDNLCCCSLGPCIDCLDFHTQITRKSSTAMCLWKPRPARKRRLLINLFVHSTLCALPQFK